MGCRGPQLDFFVAAEAKNLIDLNRISLCVEVAIYLEDGKPGDVEAVFSKNTLHTLFSQQELYLNKNSFLTASIAFAFSNYL